MSGEVANKVVARQRPLWGDLSWLASWLWLEWLAWREWDSVPYVTWLTSHWRVGPTVCGPTCRWLVSHVTYITESSSSVEVSWGGGSVMGGIGDRGEHARGGNISRWWSRRIRLSWWRPLAIGRYFWLFFSRKILLTCEWIFAQHNAGEVEVTVSDRLKLCKI
jgi:hypothetical protein